jgi:plasmid stability protein
MGCRQTLRERSGQRLALIASLCESLHVMSATLGVELSDDLRAQLERRAAREGRPASEVAAEIIRRQLAVDEFDEIRRTTVPRGREAGFHSDDDVFRAVS